MRTGIDGRFWSQSGIGRYIKNLIFQLQELDQENEYFVFLLREDFEKVEFKKNFKKVLADFGWYGFSEQIKFPKLLNRLDLDLMHFPHFNVPIFYKGKFIVTIHDLIHQNFQMRRATTLNPLIYKIKQLGYDKTFKNALEKSEKIIVPSNFVKLQLVNKWRVGEEKISITYEGVDNSILKIKNQKSKIKSLGIVRNLKVNPPYIFYVGNAHPHKNVEGLIKAFLKMDSRLRGNNRGGLQLVLAGHDHYFWQRVKAEFQDKNIKYMGNITDEQLVSLYTNAQVFVMPSFEEGFGIPLLEAMACSCPVVSSNVGSLKEVGGDASVYFDPHSSDDMADKISMVLNDQKLRRQLIEKGRSRYKQFSWEKMAKQTLEIYRSV